MAFESKSGVLWKKLYGKKKHQNACLLLFEYHESMKSSSSSWAVGRSQAVTSALAHKPLHTFLWALFPASWTNWRQFPDIHGNHVLRMVYKPGSPNDWMGRTFCHSVSLPRTAVQPWIKPLLCCATIHFRSICYSICLPSNRSYLFVKYLLVCFALPCSFY